MLSEDEFKKLARDDSELSKHLPQDLEIWDIIEFGGQGVVFEGAYQNEKSAIKFYYPGQTEKRIDREINILNKLDSDKIAALKWHGRIKINDTPIDIVAYEFLEGDTISSLLEDGKKFSEQEIYKMGHDISQVISLIWDYRIVHRDIKPDNIMYKVDGSFALIDLGVAKHLDETTLTQKGYTWGTLGYMSPEQYIARPLTCKSDVFSLGVVLSESIIGSHPTFRQQKKLNEKVFYKDVYDKLKHIEKSDLIQLMLFPRATKRPKPKEIIKAFH